MRSLLSFAFVLSLLVVSSYASSCQPLYQCVSTGQYCGQNNTNGVTTVYSCGEDTYCSRTTSLCTDYLLLNEPCGNSDVTGDSRCRTDYLCDQQTGVCTARIQPTRYLYAGEECKSNIECILQNVNGEIESACQRGKCKAVAVGGACDPNRNQVPPQCNPDEGYCSRNTSKCTRYTGDGSACNIQADNLVNGCGRDSVCVPEATTGDGGKCRALRSRGQNSPCRNDNQCQFGSYCLPGTQVQDAPPVWGTCYAVNLKSPTLGLACGDSGVACNGTNKETCGCSPAQLKINTNQCFSTLPTDDSLADANEDVELCSRRKGCGIDPNTRDYRCVYKNCKREVCGAWGVAKQKVYSANFDCLASDICGAMSLVVSPLIALLPLLALFFLF